MAFSERFFVFPYDRKTDRPNLYYLKGDHCAVAVDAGNSAEHVRAFYRELEKSKLPLPDLTVISHWHWDHTFGLCAVHGKSISTRKTQDKLREVSLWKWSPEEMRKREKTGEEIPFCSRCILEEYADLKTIRVVSTDQAITEETELDLGGIHVKLIPRESTHSDDSLFILIPEERALIVQDADCENFYESSVQKPDELIGSYEPYKLRELISFFESTDYEYHYLGHAERETKQEAIKRLSASLR